MAGPAARLNGEQGFAGDEPLLTASVHKPTVKEARIPKSPRDSIRRAARGYVYYTRESGTTDRQIGSAQPECYYNMCTASERAAACERARPDEWRASGPARGRVAAGRRRRVRRARVWLGGSVDLRTRMYLLCQNASRDSHRVLTGPWRRRVRRDPSSRHSRALPEAAGKGTRAWTASRPSPRFLQYPLLLGWRF